MDKCRSFRTYTGKRKPRCNNNDPCEACRLLHFLMAVHPVLEPGNSDDADKARYIIEHYQENL
jgi:hypothetical protein